MSQARWIDEFRLVREIGRGGFGIVYEAVQSGVERRVALKVYDAAYALDSAEGLAREAACASRIEHPNSLPVYRVGVADGVPYLAMRLVDGASLADVLKSLVSAAQQGQRLRRSDFLAAARQAVGKSVAARPSEVEDRNHYDTVVELAAQAADALAAAHAAGIVHRDVKPSNLLLEGDGRLYVADFGLARDETVATLTRTGAFAGTPRYLSPEQARGDRAAVGARSDIYSLGLTLFELITLRPAHDGETTAAVLDSIHRGTVPELRRVCPGVPMDLSNVVAKAVSADPRDRYPDMQSFARDLRRFLAHEAVEAHAPGFAKRLLRRVRRRPVAATGLALVASGVFVLGVLSLRSVVGDWSTVWRAEELHDDAVAAVLKRLDAHLQQEQWDSVLATWSALDRSVRSNSTVVARAREAAASLEAALWAMEQDLAARVEELDWAAAERHEKTVKDWRTLFVRPVLREVTEQLASPASATAVALDRIAARRALLETCPAARDLWSTDDVLVAGAYRALLREWLRLDANGSALVLQIGEHGPGLLRSEDYFELTRRRLPAVDLPLVFGGYAIDDTVTGRKDLGSGIPPGSLVLAFRKTPRFGSEDDPFAARATGSAPASFQAKARAVAAAGGSGLLIVCRSDAEEADLESLPSGLQLAVPVVVVRRERLVPILGAAGFDLARLAEQCAGSPLPESIPLGSGSLRDGFREQPSRLAHCTDLLLPTITPRLAAEPKRGVAAAIAWLLARSDSESAEQALRAVLDPERWSGLAPGSYEAESLQDVTGAALSVLARLRRPRLLAELEQLVDWGLTQQRFFGGEFRVVEVLELLDSGPEPVAIQLGPRRWHGQAVGSGAVSEDDGAWRPADEQPVRLAELALVTLEVTDPNRATRFLLPYAERGSWVATEFLAARGDPRWKVGARRAVEILAPGELPGVGGSWRAERDDEWRRERWRWFVGRLADAGENLGAAELIAELDVARAKKDWNECVDIYGMLRRFADAGDTEALWRVWIDIQLDLAGPEVAGAGRFEDVVRSQLLQDVSFVLHERLPLLDAELAKALDSGEEWLRRAVLAFLQARGPDFLPGGTRAAVQRWVEAASPGDRLPGLLVYRRVDAWILELADQAYRAGAPEVQEALRGWLLSSVDLRELFNVEHEPYQGSVIGWLGETVVEQCSALIRSLREGQLTPDPRYPTSTWSPLLCQRLGDLIEAIEAGVSDEDVWFLSRLIDVARRAQAVHVRSLGVRAAKVLVDRTDENRDFALRGLANSLYRVEEFEGALEAAERAIDQAPDEERRESAREFLEDLRGHVERKRQESADSGTTEDVGSDKR